MPTVKVIDLWAAANLMKTDKMKYVDVSILEADDDFPASLEFTAVQSLDDEAAINYDPVEAIPGDPRL